MTGMIVILSLWLFAEALTYVLESIGLKRLSASEGEGKDCYAWIPVLRMWKLGRLAAVMDPKGTGKRLDIFLPIIGGIYTAAMWTAAGSFAAAYMLGVKNFDLLLNDYVQYGEAVMPAVMPLAIAIIVAGVSGILTHEQKIKAYYRIYGKTTARPVVHTVIGALLIPYNKFMALRLGLGTRKTL